MLSLAKLRVGQEAYHLSGVAQSLDAYYTGAGEAPGRWLGGGAARLGLDGVVRPDDLRAVLAGIAPGSGGLSPNGATIRPHPKRVPGFDATFTVPKSASVLYAVSDDPRVQGAVIDAGDRAVREAIGYLERSAIEVQRGSHNKAWIDRRRAELAAAGEDTSMLGPRRLKTSGLVGAAFRHRTSRAGDPLLHWHVLIANLVEGADGKWSAFAHPDLYRHARAAGELFQAAFRAELTRTLGVEWRPGRHVPEVAGIPHSLLDQFSKRRAEIEAWLEATGATTDPAGRQAAVLATRRLKPEREGEPLDAAWKAEASAAGWGPAEADALAARWSPRAPVGVDEAWRFAAVGFDEDGGRVDYERVVSADEWIAELLRCDLTVGSTTFVATDVIQAVAQRLGAGATVDTLERLVDVVLASDQVLTVADGDGGVRYTSREVDEVERRFIDAATRTGAGWFGVDEAVVATVLATRPSLGDDQAAAVTSLCADQSGVAVLIGPAGTGKTFTLAAVRDAYTRVGLRVLGAGPSARAALELEAGAGIPARTLDALDAATARGTEQFDDRTVVVVDEAGMADIRTLERLVSAARAAGSKVILVGDQHQLPSIGAGGGFGYAAEHAATVAHLSVNRRQHEPWEQQALAELRDGDVAAAVTGYLDHDRVVVTADADGMVADAVARWAVVYDAGLRPVLLAGTNEIVDRLNGAVIDLLLDRGLLAGDEAVYGSGRYRVGDRVTLRRNSGWEHTTSGDDIAVANGQLGTVVDVAAARLHVRLDTRPDVDVVLDDGYLTRGGHISHGYALTTHRAQGGTWDVSITVGVDGLDREAAYTDLSRGSAENWLVITDPELTRLTAESHPDLDRHDRGIELDEPPEVADDLFERMSKSRAKLLAHALDADLDVVDVLVRTQPLAVLEERLAVARQAARLATDRVGADDGQLAQRLETAEHTARHAAVGVRVKALDRHNIGTIEALDDAHGAVHVVFVAADGNVGQRTLRWDAVVILDRTAPTRDLPDAAAWVVDRYRSSVEANVAAWDDHVMSLGSYPAEAEHMERAARRHVAAGAARLAGSQPDWLSELTGSRPADPIGASAWDDAVADISAWRSRHHITEPGLGPVPPEAPRRDQWVQLTQQLASTHSWLTDRERHAPSWPTVRSRPDLDERRHVLDDILENAPEDTRPLINALQAGTLGVGDVAELQRQAHAGRVERNQWILEHWPHVVEYAEIIDTLADQRWGPDHAELLSDLDEFDLDDALRAAVSSAAPWLQAAVGALDTRDADRLDDDQLDWLNDVATYRAAHDITTPGPLGTTPLNPAQRHEYDSLSARLVAVRQAVQLDLIDVSIEP